ncbi:MAG: hypothetical protein QXD04_07720 [Candidatus Bathyarchaeia archaeon]
MDVVQKALKDGIIVVATSTTTGYVLEELIGKRIEEKGMFTAGGITARGCCTTDPKGRYLHHVIEKGRVSETQTSELPKILSRMGPGDVFIKGANAIDPFGAAAIFLGGAGGGTIGTSWGYITSLGIRMIIAAGLEKLVPCSLADVARRTGVRAIDRSLGMPVGMMVVEGDIITEMEAINILTGAVATPIGGGGVDGGEGSRTFIIEGDEKSVTAAYELLSSIKGEPPVRTRTRSCEGCEADCDYKKLETSKKRKSN